MDMPLDHGAEIDLDAEIARLVRRREEIVQDARNFSPWKIVLICTFAGFGFTTVAIVISIAILHLMR
jgi:hypothetical protein